MMLNQRIVLFGRNGQLGAELSHFLIHIPDFWSFSSKEADFLRPEIVTEVLDQFQPEIIINTAAYNGVDRAEDLGEKEKALRINAETPGLLAQWAQKKKALLIHFSTDYVFDGNKRVPYLETDSANPLSFY